MPKSADDPFWSMYYPTYHMRCRSRVVSVSDREMQRSGLKLADDKQIEHIPAPAKRPRHRRVHREPGQILLRSVDRNFREGGRYDIGSSGEFVGGATHWIVSSRARRQSGQTLMDTGQLAISITSEATSQGVPIRTNKAYGAIHHFGGQAGRNKNVTLPA